MPTDDRTLPLLYGVARRVLANEFQLGTRVPVLCALRPYRRGHIGAIVAI